MDNVQDMSGESIPLPNGETLLVLLLVLDAVVDTPARELVRKMGALASRYRRMEV